MKKRDLPSLGKLLLVPALLILLGLILLICPDAASVMIAKIVGYLLVLFGIGTGVAAVFSQRGKIGKGFAAVVLVMAGGWLTLNPLLLAAWAGRFLGVMILINSMMDLIYARRQGRNILFQGISALIGAILLLLPMTASRLVFRLCGLAVLVIGAAMVIDRLRSRRWLDAGEDPNIIDAL